MDIGLPGNTFLLVDQFADIVTDSAVAGTCHRHVLVGDDIFAKHPLAGKLELHVTQCIGPFTLWGNGANYRSVRPIFDEGKLRIAARVRIQISD